MIMNDFSDQVCYADENTKVTGIFTYQSKKMKMTGKPAQKVYPGIWFMEYSKLRKDIGHFVVSTKVHNILCTHCMIHSSYNEWRNFTADHGGISRTQIFHPLTGKQISPVYVCPRCGAWNYKGSIYGQN